MQSRNSKSLQAKHLKDIILTLLTNVNFIIKFYFSNF